MSVRTDVLIAAALIPGAICLLCGTLGPSPRLQLGGLDGDWLGEALSDGGTDALLRALLAEDGKEP